jgi:hypothetical protein
MFCWRVFKGRRQGSNRACFEGEVLSSMGAPVSSVLAIEKVLRQCCGRRAVTINKAKVMSRDTK